MEFRLTYNYTRAMIGNMSLYRNRFTIFVFHWLCMFVCLCC